MANHAISQSIAALAGSIPGQPAAPAIEQQPAVSPGHRLVPVRVGRTNATSITTWIECPHWCVEDHFDDAVCAIEDVMHRGVNASVLVPTFGHGSYPVQMYAWVESDPVAEDSRFKAAHIAVADKSGDEGSHITPEMALKLADDLIGFAAELRHMANTARQANAVSPRLSLLKRQGGGR